MSYGSGRRFAQGTEFVSASVGWRFEQARGPREKLIPENRRSITDSANVRQAPSSTWNPNQGGVPQFRAVTDPRQAVSSDSSCQKQNAEPLKAATIPSGDRQSTDDTAGKPLDISEPPRGSKPRQKPHRRFPWRLVPRGNRTKALRTKADE